MSTDHNIWALSIIDRLAIRLMDGLFGISSPELSPFSGHAPELVYIHRPLCMDFATTGTGVGVRRGGHWEYVSATEMSVENLTESANEQAICIDMKFLLKSLFRCIMMRIELRKRKVAFIYNSLRR